jgi:uncharacterized repeat protein (TIGR03843 family)
MPASNATFVGEIDGVRVVYKPVAGERPLWDFPDGTLAAREVAAHLLSRASGWDVVPPTWYGTGPHGPGMLQLWQEPDPGVSAVDVVPRGEVPPGFLAVFEGVGAGDVPVTLVHEDSAPLRRMALFDVVTNNADRKGGHVLGTADGRRLGVDHGLTFHVEPKLRTVLWGWAGEPLLVEELEDLRALRAQLAGDLGVVLAELLTADEVAATRERVDRLLRIPLLPLPGEDWPSIPWPPF